MIPRPTMVVVTLMFVRFFTQALEVVGSKATSSTGDGGSTDEYFRLMKLYLGDSYSMHPCLQEQEANGWHTTAKLPTNPFTLGVEGSGHHAIETLLANGFTTIKGNGGQQSVPSSWRRFQLQTKPRMHPDIRSMVSQERLIIVLTRYPPSSLMSSINRFQKNSEKFGTRITGRDEVYTLHDSLSVVDDLLRFPDFDCGRLIIVPFEILTQRPMAMYGPLSQALSLDQMGSKGYELLKRRLQGMLEHEQKASSSGSSRYELDARYCSDLHLKHGGKGNIDDAEPKKRMLGVRANMTDTNQSRQASDSLESVACANRVYDFAQSYFDSRKFMFPSLYPSQEIIKASSSKHPRAGLLLVDAE